MALWVYDPHSGGVKISIKLQTELLGVVKDYSRGRTWHPSHELVLRFKMQFCYVSTIEIGEDRQSPLCRLRHFNKNRFSLALFTYSNERYEICYFSDGSATGKFIDALELCEPFIV